MSTATILHACGHKARVTLPGGTAATVSAAMFDASVRDCPQCEATKAPECPRCGLPMVDAFGDPSPDFCETCFQEFGRSDWEWS